MATILTQVRLATTVNIDLTTNLTIGVSKIDGVIVGTNNRILVKAQTNKVQNGIYTLNSSGVWARASDWASASTQDSGTLVFVQEGATFADTGWVVSTDGVITVNTTPTTWERFSLNLTLPSTDLPSSIILRREKGYPLTNDEVDNNFKYLSVSLTEKLDSSLFTGPNISSELALLTAVDANLNAWLVRDMPPSEAASNLTIATRTSTGDLYANTFYGNLSGNASTATSATYATTAGNISGSGIVGIINGGTGSNTAAGARSTLGAVAIAGDTMTGKLVLPAATTESASLRIIPSSITISAPVAGDIWSTTAGKVFYRTTSANNEFAFIDSPTFTGSPSAPTADINSNSTALATTAYVQLHRAQINTAISLKANIDSPTFTGTPLAPTPATADNSTKIATTAYTVSKISDVLTAYPTIIAMNSAISTALTSYSTTTAMNSAISTALSSYSTTVAMNNAISSALASYYTKAQIDATIANYSTTTAMNNAITNALSNYSTTSVMNSAISSAISNYYTKSQIDTSFANYSTTSAMNTAISNAIANYYTKAQIDSTISNYSTTSAMNTAITNATSPKANTTYVDGLQDKWGSSRKFVQTATPTGAVNGDFWFKI